jgi:DNA-binding YbaB/EbfC family protein
VIPNLESLGQLFRNSGMLRESMEKATEALGRIEAEGTAGGGSITVKANGRQEITAIRIDRKLLAEEDLELLEELLAAACNQALARSREAAAEKITSLSLPFSRLFGERDRGG